MRPFAPLFCLLAMGALHAQDTKPFQLNMDRVEDMGVKALGASKTYFIPSVHLLLAANGSIWAQKGGAQAKGKFWVKGLDKGFVQGLAKKVQDDLIAKLRAGGFTVLTYEDLKATPDMTGRERMSPDKHWGLPLRKEAGGNTFVIGAPSDEQAIEQSGLTGPVFQYKGLAKERNIVVLLPEIAYTAPQMGKEVSEGYSFEGKADFAGINIQPAMKLFAAAIYGVNAKQDMARILVQQHGVRLAAEKAGKIEKVSQTDTEFSKEWQRTSADFAFTIDPAAYGAGVLRVGYAINDLILLKVKKAH